MLFLTNLPLEKSSKLSKTLEIVHMLKLLMKSKTIYSFEHQKLANDISNKLGKKVRIKVSKNGKGKIEIPFNTKQDLYELISKFGL